MEKWQKIRAGIEPGFVPHKYRMPAPQVREIDLRGESPEEKLPNTPCLSEAVLPTEVPLASDKNSHNEASHKLQTIITHIRNYFFRNPRNFLIRGKIIVNRDLSQITKPPQKPSQPPYFIASRKNDANCVRTVVFILNL
ncbi:hypothetical protein LF95_17905 [Thalassospira sp. TSL5-1]|nr:hypothetical protein LF95_17905 [Thalassospira sp. TSL5-1]